MSDFYSKKIEEVTKYFYNRHCAALLTMHLPHGGRKYISSLLKIDTRTINEGKLELGNKNVVVEGIR